MKIKHFCDQCGYQINEEYEEVPVYILDLPKGAIFNFCSENCRDDFVKECFIEGYILPSGSIERD